ncbi:MAG: TOBE domain-containing protein [Candidatus Bathyarchaeota archaeon]
MAKIKSSPAFKVWLEYEGKRLIGKGGTEILATIDRTGSLTATAKEIKMSYKYLWGQLANMEKALNQPVIVRRRGGKFGGGGATLTEAGRVLLQEYKRVELYLKNVLDDKEYWEAIGLKISARNRLEGIIKEITTGVTTTSVKIQVKSPVIITAIITKEATDELKLKPGEAVQAVIKSTEVMIAKE